MDTETATDEPGRRRPTRRGLLAAPLRTSRHRPGRLGGDPHRTGRYRPGLWWYPLAIAALVAADAVVYVFIRRRGVGPTGDEPHYLVVARAIDHLTVHPLAAYVADLHTHRLFDWAPGTPATNLALQLYTGPHGPVSTHPVGLSVLLAPFVAVGGALAGRLGLMALNAAGFVYLLARGCRLAGLGRGGRLVAAVILVSPALWVAATQIYPDFPTGVLLGCAAVDILVLERSGTLDGWAVAVTAGTLAVLPWLHQQNLVAAGFLLVALVWLGVRAGRRRAVAVVASVAVASWVVLLAFNQREYGHLLGLPQPFPSLNSAGVTEILGLLFDRHQGLFVQMPLAVLGLLGMWWAGRRGAVTAVATLAAAASLLYLNGTFIHAPYGGVSFAGRFQWSSLVPLLVWCPFAVAAVGRSAVRLRVLGAAAAILWLLQAVPILAGQHAYYNQLAVGSPWDPVAYPGWWGRLDRLLPVMVPGGRLFGRPGFALVTEIVLLATLAGLAAAGARPGGRPAGVASGGALAVAAGAVAIMVAAPLPLPAGPLDFSGPDLGSPFVTGPAPAHPALPLQVLQPGLYRLTVRYVLAGAGMSAVLAPYCAPRTPPGDRPAQPEATQTLDPGRHTATVTLRCPAAMLWFAAEVGPATALTVGDVRLAKTAAG